MKEYLEIIGYSLLFLLFIAFILLVLFRAGYCLQYMFSSVLETPTICLIK